MLCFAVTLVQSVSRALMGEWGVGHQAGGVPGERAEEERQKKAESSINTMCVISS